jgi:predicted patatin/cPLA2 family phospholipase
MQEKLISLKTAKKAKEKGFDNHIIIGNVYNSEPTQSLLQKWLREVHRIDVQVLRNKPGYDEYKVEIYKTDNTNSYIHFWIKEEDYIKWFESYEDALEEGLFEALNLVND